MDLWINFLKRQDLHEIMANGALKKGSIKKNQLRLAGLLILLRPRLGFTESISGRMGSEKNEINKYFYTA